ncbi:MAG: CHAT domain-containing protein [Polyangia bacterium]
MREHRSDFERLVEWQPWEFKQQALHRALRGDIRGAIGLVEQGQQLAERTGNWTSLYDLGTFGADLFARLGRLQQAVALLGEPVKHNRPDGEGLHACRQIEGAFAKADLWLRAREAEPRLPLPPGLPEPLPLLLRALELTRECDQPQRRSTAFTYLARVALQRGELTTAEAWITKVQQTEAENDRALTPYWLHVQAEIALKLGKLDVARTRLERLLRFAQRLLLPEFEWHSLIGLAQLAEQEAGVERQAQARTFYEQAERLLDQEALTAPLGLGRGGFLGRYQRGTALFLEFLVRRGELTAALQVLRHARVRGIRSLSVLTQIPQILTRAPQEYQAALSEYHAARAELNAVAWELPRVPKDREVELTQRQQQLNERALRALERLVHSFGELSADNRSSARPPVAGEALLACHPGTNRWLCLLADPTGIWFTPVATSLIEEDQPQRALAAALLEPFRAPIERADRLTVIAYGALRELDIQLLPFGPSGQPLKEGREVVFALDLPGQRAGAPVGPAKGINASAPAYVLIDPEGRFDAIRGTATGIRTALQQLRFRVIQQGTGVIEPSGPAAVHQALNSGALQDQISHSVFFHAAAHMDYPSANGWRHALPLSDDAGLMLSDILTLPKVPAYVSLFTCQSGRTSEEWGSAEGMGMVQAFLTQGSQWGIGTSRQVKDALAASISQRFFRELAAQGDLRSPVRALYAAMPKDIPLPESTRQRQPDTDIGAFRVYVP